MENPPPPARPHFLIITYPAQGHLNPALHLSRRLASSTTADVTFSTATAAHRRMFPSLPSPSSATHHNGITYIPFSDGSSSSSSHHNHSDTELRSLLSQMAQSGSKHLRLILLDLAATGRPVTRVIYSIMLKWAGDVAADLGIPSALYWIQAATVLSIYHHFFNGYESLVVSHAKDPSFTVSFPSLPPVQIRDLPPFFTTASPKEPFILDAFRELFGDLSLRRQAGGVKPRVLVNSFDELEMNAVASMEEHLELITVGPLSVNEADGETEDMFEQTEKKYMEWLDSREDKSVVYASFGSVHKMSEEEMEEIRKGLIGSQRPYLWVVRKDSRGKDVNLGGGEEKQGMVVEWCRQERVLRHRAVGCFVTHCGWNSTAEALVSGVPAVAMPTWSDQSTNAWLMERQWGVAVKPEAGGEWAGRVGGIEEVFGCCDGGRRERGGDKEEGGDVEGEGKKGDW